MPHEMESWKAVARAEMHKWALLLTSVKTYKYHEMKLWKQQQAQDLQVMPQSAHVPDQATHASCNVSYKKQLQGQGLRKWALLLTSIHI